MGNPAVMTALCMCTFGAAPAPLSVTSQSTVTDVNMLAGTIMDFPKPPMTFGVCISTTNPAVIAATAASYLIPVEAAAALLNARVIPPVPAPCVPACSPWTPGSPTVLICSKPALNITSKCMCSFGGAISITMTPAMTVQIP